MADIKPVRIFIASSNELIDERKLCIQIITRLNESHKHLHLKPVEWEISMVHSNYPEHEDIQGAIDPKLKESDLVIFIFYSKIGKYTRREFEFANNEKKRLFAFFKTGFSPDVDTLENYGELLKFKKSLNDSVLYKEYDDLDNFEKLSYPNLNLYLIENFPAVIDEVDRVSVNALSQSNQQLIQLLAAKEEEIKMLRKNANEMPDATLQIQISELLQDKEAIRSELLQSEEVKNQLVKDKEALEKQLAPQIEHDNLKAKALEEIGKGNYAEAENYLMQSAKASVEETASTFFELAKIKKLQLQYAEALHYYEIATKIAPDSSLYLNEAGMMLNDLGYYDKAIGFYEKALKIDQGIHGDEHKDIAAYNHNLGMAYDYIGKYNKAIEYYEKALKIDLKLGGDENLGIATSYNNIGLVYHHKKEYTIAIEYYLKALEIDKKFRDENPDTGVYYNNLGLSHHGRQEFDTAIKYYKIALKIGREFLGKNHPDMSGRYNNIGVTYRAKGKYQKAIDFYKMALDIDSKLFGEDHPNIAVEYNNIGIAYDYMGEYDKAIDFCQKALNIFLKFLPEIHPTALTIKENIEVAKEKQKK